MNRLFVAIATAHDGRSVRVDSRSNPNITNLRKAKSAVRSLASRYPNFGKPKLSISTHALNNINPKGWEKAETVSYSVEAFNDPKYSRPRYRIVSSFGPTFGNFKLKREAIEALESNNFQ